jgi:Chalcone isomerase-like
MTPDVRLPRRTALRLLAALPATALASRPPPALPPELKGELRDAQLLGEGRLRYLGLHVYDIRLWAEAELSGRDLLSQPLALELEYARALEGKAIAERSLKEMQGLESIDAALAERWLQQMRQIVPDVKKGDRITGVQRPGEAALFFVNGQPRGEVRDAEFTRLFFGIWLSPRTSQPKLREALLGTRVASS